MNPIEFDPALWSCPPPEACRHAVGHLWRGLVDAGLDPAVYVESLPDFVRWNAATEVIEGLDLGISALANWEGQPWLPDAVLKNARDLIERMCEPIEAEPEFLGLDSFCSDPRWESIRADARALVEEQRVWVEAVGLVIDPARPRDASVDPLR